MQVLWLAWSRSMRPSSLNVFIMKPTDPNQVLYQLSYTGIAVPFITEWGDRTTDKNAHLRALCRPNAGELFFCQSRDARIVRCGGQGAWGGLSYAPPRWCTNLPEAPVVPAIQAYFGLLDEGAEGYETWSNLRRQALVPDKSVGPESTDAFADP